jgi:GNAT superfamily N-acetyltransferase
MQPSEISFELASPKDFDRIYLLCENTMRLYVEANLGDCFEKLARRTISDLLQRGLFTMLYADGIWLGALAQERHATHIQLEELYVQPAQQNQGVGTNVMAHLMGQSKALSLPIHLHVLRSNPARVFYERLGFLVVRSTPVVHHMAYRPG